MASRKLTVLSLMTALVVILALVSGCGGGGTSTDNVRVSITDASSANYESIIIAISAIYAVPHELADQQDNTNLPLICSFATPRQVDVMQLAYQQELLGEATIPAGEYCQLHLVLAPNVEGQDPVNYIVEAGDPTHWPLTTPSGQTAGMKLLGPFVVVDGEMTSLVIDFDPDWAIVERGASGEYNIKPSGIRLSCTSDYLDTYGALTGCVLPAEAWPTAQVSVYPVGETDPIATGSLNQEDGSFRAIVPPGDYWLKVTAEGYLGFDTITSPDFADAFTVVTGADTAVTGATTEDPPVILDCITLDPDVPA